MNIFRRFLKSIRANTGLMFALAAVPITMAGGMAVDYTRAQLAGTEIQAALDSAVLASATTQGDNAARIQAGKKQYARNFTGSPGVTSGIPDIQIMTNGTVVASIEASISTTLMGVAGFDELTISKNSEANGGGIGKVEIVFVLDYSSSMDDQYQPMRNAVIALINDITQNGTNTDVKIGLVPFAGEVYVTLPGNYVIGATPGVPWTNCTVDRKWPWTVNDETPTALADSQWGRLYENETPLPADFVTDCTSYPANQLVTRPLTTEHAGTIAQLQSMTPHAGTNVAAGLEFGWQVVSPNAPWTQGVSYADEDWRKIIVLLTDGAHNKKGYGPGGIYTEDQGSANVSTACQNIKSNNILMVTVAYELDDEEGKAQLQACASQSQFYLEGTEENIADVFNSIGNMLQKEVFLSK